PAGEGEIAQPVEDAPYVEKGRQLKGEALTHDREVYERPARLHVGQGRDRPDEAVLPVATQRPEPSEPLPVAVRQGERCHREEGNAIRLYRRNGSSGED